MIKELEALESIEATIELGLKDSIHFEALDVTVNLDKGAFLNDVIIIRQALKRNQPMKAVSLDSTKYYGFENFECPKCKSSVDGADKFCSECGQRLDWSDEE